MGLVDKNMSILKDYHPVVYNIISGIDDDESIEVIESKAGDSVPLINTEGKRLYIHSRFDPFREAERFISEIDPEKHDLFIVFGFGFGYHIELLLGRIGKDSNLFVIEKNAAMLKAAISHRDLSALFEDKRVIILANPDEDAIAESLKGKSSLRVTFITHRGSHQLNPGYYSNLLEISRSYLSTKDVNIATLAKFEKIWSSNVARNIRQFILSPGANIFYNKFTNIPAIIAAAGPSLTQSLDFIRHNQEKFIIIAVDTSYMILKSHGIDPHFCISVDPQVVNARYFEGSRPNRTILISDPTVHPSVFRLFRGRVVITGVAFQMMKWIERLAGEKGETTHGGSVSTNAYDFAKRLGASPVIFLGQDLAFTWGLAHARGSYLDEQVFFRTNRLKNIQMFNRSQLTALPGVYVKGIRSERVHTNQKMMIFLSWFEKRRDKLLINSTYEGAFIPGVKHAGIEDIEFDNSEQDITGMIDDIYKPDISFQTGFQENRKRLLNRIDLMLGEIDSLIPPLNRAIGFSENFQNMMKGEVRDKSKLDYILRKLSETDKIIESKENIKDMISFTVQRVIHTITEGYEIDEKDSALNENELVARRSQYLYRGLMEGALFNKKVLGKMAVMLETEA